LYLTATTKIYILHCSKRAMKSKAFSIIDKTSKSRRKEVLEILNYNTQHGK
jgi:hypothetical protein